MPDQNQVRLVVAGVAYTGWQSVSIERSLEHPAHQFELSVFDQWAGGTVRVPVGAPYQLFIDTTLISTGYIDKVERHYDAKTRSVTVSGRSKAADLIDCSWPLDEQPSSWSSLSVLAVCNILAKPFGITVTDTSGLASHPLQISNVRAGDKMMELMQMYMRGIGARIVSLPNGNLQIVSAGTDRLATGITLGQNVLTCDDTQNLQDRFSEYHMLSQPSSRNGQSIPSLNATLADATMKALRYRPDVVVPHQMLTSQAEVDAAARVARNVAAGKSHVTTYAVNGWQHSAGLWEPNHLVKVVDPECGWNDWLMIGAVTLKTDQDGQIAHLHVMPATAFDITAEPPSLSGGAL